jgi:hypothetical protein
MFFTGVTIIHILAQNEPVWFLLFPKMDSGDPFTVLRMIISDQNFRMN